MDVQAFFFLRTIRDKIPTLYSLPIQSVQDVCNHDHSQL